MLPPIEIKPGLCESATWQTRVADIPYSAPIYDSLVRPITYPKSSGCLRMQYGDGTDICHCNLQQGTRLAVSHRVCLDVIKNGLFDWAASDDEFRVPPRPVSVASRFEGGAAETTGAESASSAAF